MSYRQNSKPGAPMMVHVVVDGQKKWRAVAKHICLAFHGSPPDSGMCVVYENRDHNDVRPANLRWGWRYENAEPGEEGREFCYACYKPLRRGTKSKTCPDCSRSYERARKQGKGREWWDARASSLQAQSRRTGKRYPEWAEESIEAYVADKDTAVTLAYYANRLHVTEGCFRRWVAAYRERLGIKAPTRRQNVRKARAVRWRNIQYPEHVKREVVRDLIRYRAKHGPDGSARVFAKRYGVDERTIYRWLKKYGGVR